MLKFRFCGFVLILYSAISVAAQSAANPCENPETNAFDFQIGVWQSEDGKQTHEIRKTFGGCAIEEIWKTDGKASAFGFKSFDNGNHHKTGEKKWFYSWFAPGFHQLWEGRKENGQWRFYRDWYLNGEAVLSRTYWNPLTDGSLERIIEQSRDGGKTWRLHVKHKFVKKPANAASDLYRLNPEKSFVKASFTVGELKQASAATIENLYPAWSPDGKFIAFTSNRGGNYDIYVIRPDGSGLRRLTTAPAIDAHPMWSPDSKFLSFDSQRDGNRETYTMKADGTGQRNISRNPANDGTGSWSPDGKKLVFDSDREMDDEVFVMNADGSETRRITNSPKQDQAPSWFPDGKRLVFESRREGNREIYAMQADGSGQKNLTNHEEHDFLPSVSPDGKKIAFFSRRDGNEEIYVMNADGSGLQKLTDNPANDRMPRWSPDGARIVFSSNRDGVFDLYLMNSDGKNVTRLTYSEAEPNQSQAKTVDFAELEKTIESELKENKTPGAAIAIVSGERILFAKGFGTTSAEDGNSVSADTLFRMGSTTKMFTAATLASLANEGKLKLDAPIGNYVKNLPPKISALTPHQLLSQSSGLRDFAPLASGNDDAALGNNIRAWKDDVFFTEPNRIYSYSSANYWLAGFLSEELTGKPYADALAEILFKPLGMTRSTIRPTVAMTYPLALGHDVREGKAAIVRPIDNNAAKYPGGSMYSSANELARFCVAMLSGGRLEGRQALAPFVVENLQKPQFYLPGEERAFYGYGLLGFEERGVKTVSHGGASRGYGSMITFAPAQKIAVIVLANTSGQTLPKTRQKAMELLLPLKPVTSEQPKLIAATAEELKSYTGTFSHEPQKWEFFVKNDKLHLRQGGKEYAFEKTGKDKFFNAEQGEFLFVANERGDIEHLFMGLYAARKM